MKSMPLNMRTLLVLLFAAGTVACGGGGGEVSLPPPGGIHVSQWAWIKGSNVRNSYGVYGTQGTPDADNIPGGRSEFASWIDGAGHFWLFGGFGYGSSGTAGHLNDLWHWNGTHWTWISGGNTVDQQGVYSSPGSDIPGGRRGAASWIDSNGDFWLFGGFGEDNAGTTGYLNDLWKWDGTSWSWVSGSNTVNPSGVYGALGIAAGSNVPGGRQQLVSWIDSSDNLWLFGGNGRDSTGTLGILNDLWKWDGADWTWISGSSSVNQTGNYGILGTANFANHPGARNSAVGWIAANGDLWLFGGFGYEASGLGLTGQLSDLWRWDGTNWTWMAGPSARNQLGIYGTLNTPGNNTNPGSRQTTFALKDSSGHFMLYGGFGYDSGGTRGSLNDLWRWDGARWTWISGSSSADQAGIYGTQNSPGPGNRPGGRTGGAIWIDADSKFWLFAGEGLDIAGESGYLNDQWQFTE